MMSVSILLLEFDINNDICALRAQQVIQITLRYAPKTRPFTAITVLSCLER